MVTVLVDTSETRLRLLGSENMSCGRVGGGFCDGHVCGVNFVCVDGEGID